jgi:hypothetical protein
VGSIIVQLIVSFSLVDVAKSFVDVERVIEIQKMTQQFAVISLPLLDFVFANTFCTRNVQPSFLSVWA